VLCGCRLAYNNAAEKEIGSVFGKSRFMTELKRSLVSRRFLQDCPHCHKNLKVIRRSALVVDDLGVFCCLSCLEHFKLEKDHASVRGRVKSR
jgi:hypothetical protein